MASGAGLIPFWVNVGTVPFSPFRCFGCRRDLPPGSEGFRVVLVGAATLFGSMCRECWDRRPEFVPMGIVAERLDPLVWRSLIYVQEVLEC